MANDIERPEWSWFPPETAQWWTPARVWWDLTTHRIAAHQVLPRLVGCSHDTEFDDSWVERFDPPRSSLVDDDPHVSTVPGPMSHRWLELLARWTHGDRSATLAGLADVSSDSERRARESLQLRELHLLMAIVTLDEAWTEGGWLARGSFWFLNGGLVTPSTLLDLIELEAQYQTAMLPDATVLGVLADVDEETDTGRVVAVHTPGISDGDASRTTAGSRIAAWLAGEELEPVGDLPFSGYLNKVHRYGRMRGILAWCSG